MNLEENQIRKNEDEKSFAVCLPLSVEAEVRMIHALVGG
jgi:hypothetical protein